MNNKKHKAPIQLSEYQADMLNIPEDARIVNSHGCTVHKDILELHIKAYQGDFFSLLEKNKNSTREPLEQQNQDFLVLLVNCGPFNFNQRLGKSNNYKSILDYTLQHHWERVFDSLIIDKIAYESNVFITHGDYKGDIPLEVVIAENNNERAKLIIDKMGEKILYSGQPNGYSALGFAVDHNNGELAALILKKNAFEFGPNGKCLPGKSFAESWDVMKALIITACGIKKWKEIMLAYPHLDKLIKHTGFCHVCQLMNVNLNDPMAVLALYAQHIICRIKREVKNLEHREHMLLPLTTYTDQKSLAAAIISTESSLLRETHHFWQRKADISCDLPKEVLEVMEIKALLNVTQNKVTPKRRMED